MDDNTNSLGCERALDLMAFLYREMDATETREFDAHLQTCGICREEAASFGLVRESIVAWRDEVLMGFVPSTTRLRRSALAAFRQFFDLSPLWLKGAAAFAVLTFCVLAGLLFVNFRKEATTDVVYTQQDVDRLVREALAKQQAPVEKPPLENAPVNNVPESIVAVNPRPQRRSVKKQTPQNRRPLSRAEREQLAADLRLLSTDDDLDLLGDRINE